MARPPCNSPVATRLRSPNGSAGVPIASELAASVALDRSTRRNPGPRGMSEGHQTSRSSAMTKKKGPKKKSKGY